MAAKPMQMTSYSHHFNQDVGACLKVEREAQVLPIFSLLFAEVFLLRGYITSMRATRVKSTQGSMMIEVVVSVLLIGTLALALAPLLLTPKGILSQDAIRQKMRVESQKLLAQLQDYRPMEYPPVWNEGAPGTPAWHLAGDVCKGCAGGPISYAFDVGTHDVSSRLPPELAAYGATLIYTVSIDPVTQLREVKVDATFQTPGA